MNARSALLMFTGVAVLGASSQGWAASKGYTVTDVAVMQCDGADEAKVCMSLPEEAPESTTTEKAPLLSPEKSPEKSVSMLGREESSGGALDIENNMIRALAVDPLLMVPAPGVALGSGQRAQAQARAIETFLKNGIASTGDLTVVTTGKRK